MKPEDTDTIFDIIKNGQDLFIEEKFFEGYLLIRENTDKSEISNNDIMKLLKGEASLYWESHNIFDVIDRPNIYQFSRVEKLKERYKDLIVVENRYFETIKEVDYSFFEMISPRKYTENVLHPIAQLKSFMMDVQGQYFIIKEDKVRFVNEKNIGHSNPFL